jgi:hypothetical protein
MTYFNNLGQARVGWRIPSGEVTPSYLLDTYTGASAAYSLRKLRSAYTGNAIRVRRSSDDTTLDVGFKADGTLDTTAMLSFVGAGNGFVSIWYDQSGNGYNLIQETSTKQLQIVSSGSVLLLNGKPTLYSDGTGGKSLRSTFGVTLSQPNTFFNIGSSNKPANSSTYYLWDGITSTQRNAIAVSQTNLRTFAGTVLTYTYASSVSTQYLTFAKFNGASSSVAVNAGTATTGNAGTQSLTGISLNTSYGPANEPNIMQTNYQELILWNADKTTDRTGISNNINAYYTTY